ncbi:hypothetical protein [Schlesneria paludicola]|uniref:hypothetical protein n=1 Tax=Schlesneria paludicola TaxID=360056 RepID=UPI00029A389D|nr:hypothetical protein [Schlesneria paludicola]
MSGTNRKRTALEPSVLPAELLDRLKSVRSPALDREADWQKRDADAQRDQVAAQAELNRLSALEQQELRFANSETRAQNLATIRRCQVYASDKFRAASVTMDLIARDRQTQQAKGWDAVVETCRPWLTELAREEMELREQLGTVLLRRSAIAKHLYRLGAPLGIEVR